MAAGREKEKKKIGKKERKRKKRFLCPLNRTLKRKGSCRGALRCQVGRRYQGVGEGWSVLLVLRKGGDVSALETVKRSGGRPK